jgi:[acyl-carrier-protein] S-malonyltransferase
MNKIAFIFSGQGAQYVGMGKEIFDGFSVSRNIFKKADEILGFELSKLCFEGSTEELDKTENTQPCVVTVSTAILKVLEEKGIKPDVTAGLSLGEYSALVCSNVLEFATAVALVKKRGKFMQEAVPLGVGTMAAILGLSSDVVNEICAKASVKGIVEPANYNCPGQIVIGGEVEAVNFACEITKNIGGKGIPLSVSAPFHTSMLESASAKLSDELKNIELSDIRVPIITNVTGDYIASKDEVKDLLKRQVKSPVHWESTIRRMISDGVDTFVEIGPGKVLSGFVKKVDRKLTVLNVEDIKSLKKTIEVLEGNIC